jgi:ACS family hexuronate transporter-like MFS transporter
MKPLQTAPEQSILSSGSQQKIGRFRWTICALLFFATTINYIDRQVLGILAPDLQKSLHISDIAYGDIVAAFQGAYAIGLLLFGGIMDRVGTRKGLAGAVVVWSVAAMGHILAHSAVGFGAARFALGLGEAGNFPAAIKTVAEWFPKRERALATGIFNAGSNVGAIAAPLMVPWLTLKYGWPSAFFVTGILGFVWLIFWLAIYRKPEEHPRLSPQERAYIESDAEEATTKIPWIQLIGLRQTWAFAIGKFLTDPVWWFYLSWLPKFLNKTHGLTLNKLGPPLIVIYVLADFGSIGGGWLSSFLIQRGMSVSQARKTAMLICALLVTPIILVSHISNLWGVVLLIGLAAAAHQGWSANLFTLASDTFPRRAVGSVIGFGGMLGAIGGMFVAVAVGILLQKTHGNYVPLFFIAGFAYVFAYLVIYLVNPQMKPAVFRLNAENTNA